MPDGQCQLVTTRPVTVAGGGIRKRAYRLEGLSLVGTLLRFGWYSSSIPSEGSIAVIWWFKEGWGPKEKLNRHYAICATSTQDKERTGAKIPFPQEI